MYKKIRNCYLYFVNLPDKMYPFSRKINGKFVRGQKAYLESVKEAFELNGEGVFGFRILFYREVFHLIGSISFITLIALISKKIWGGDFASLFLVGSAIIALTFQEFYFQPKSHKQKTKKGVIDWLTWVVPVFIYFLIFDN